MNIDSEIKKAMLAGDRGRANTLRSLKSAASNAALLTGNIGNALSQTELLNVVRKQIKQRQDSIEQFTRGGRADLAAKEEQEVQVLQEFLPKSLTNDEIDAIVDKSLLHFQATSKRDMGKVMKFAAELAGGRVDGKTLSAKISAKLV